MKWLMRSFIFLCCLLSGLTLFPEFHRGVDTVSMLLPILGICCFVAIFWIKPLLAKGMVSLFALFSIGATIASIPLPSKNGDFRVYSKNVRNDNASTADLFLDIGAADVDAVMLQEVSNVNRDLLKMLQDEFPFQHLCPGNSSTALLSKSPFVDVPRCSNSRAFLLAPIEIGSQKVWLGSIHLHWPWPSNSKAAEMETWSALKELDGPIVVAGDFNAPPWSTRMKRFQTLTGSDLVGPLHFTLRHKKLPIPLPIDHILSPHGGSLTVRPLIGSDHHGLVGALDISP